MPAFRLSIVIIDEANRHLVTLVSFYLFAAAFHFLFRSWSRLPWPVVLKILEQNVGPASDADRLDPAVPRQVGDRLVRDASEYGRFADGEHIVRVDFHSSKLLSDG